ncbi:hypothetical protein ABH930_001546 [Kitasatospora sp. GAS204A]|uniref:DUF4188 domain-containing protein n=1 Tax=unclassified Kitasatospora TaxID=2633591 RepID=UPI0024769634|nr:DUF4188 domain-containing protein [Kitasatospora sp. GAS204B]MDH6118546.1 hypothetical protein [Kitasatospora sp. GAS204B]
MSAAPIPGRITAAAEGGTVVFHIGMRINNFRALRSWWPTVKAMPGMLRELAADPDSGMLGGRLRLGSPRDLEVIQYWESHEKLLAYATAQDHKHRPAWTEFNRRVRAGHGKVGIWHETYLVPAGAYETIYVNMPPHGLAAATGTAPISRRGNTAAERLGLRPSS